MTPRIEQYAREEARRFGVRPKDVLGRSRQWAIIGARSCVIRRLYRDGFSMAQIGRWLGYYDHTTVRHFINGPERQP